MPVPARFGSTPRSKRAEASLRSFSRRDVRRTDFISKAALSNRTVVVCSETSVSVPPITPASAIARSASAITSVSVSSCADVIERFEHLVLARAPYHDAIAGQAVIIEGVKRLAVFEHHIVGDIDDVADRSHSCLLQPPGHPLRGRADLNALDDGADIPGAKLRRLDGYQIGLCRRNRAKVDTIRFAQCLVVERADLARHTEN